MKIIRLLVLTLAVLIAAASFVSCGGDGAETEETRTSTAEAQTGDERPDVNVDFSDIYPEYVNPLTGLEASYDVSSSRPLGVMLNNIYDALPQVGVGDADIIFECLAEGGITRLFALFSEYNDLGVIGSVRSARPYYIDFAQMFDAIYCHAGGSEDAYSELAARGIDNIDGVRGDPLGVYYRDPQRLQTMSLEHTLMTTGEGLINTIEYCSFRTDLREGYEYPFTFAEFNKKNVLDGDECLKIHIPLSFYQTVDYEYDAENDVYLRYQYNMTPHIDGGTGEQLSFTNVIVLFCNTYQYDDYGRLRVETTGDGAGYLASEGKYVPINWHRDGIDGNLKLTLTDETPIVLNRGKTFINVCPLATEYEINMNMQ